jgi:hypothetical protein
MSKFNELEEEINKWKRVVQVGRCTGSAALRSGCSQPSCCLRSPWRPGAPASRRTQGGARHVQADRQELAEYEQQSAAARSKGLFFKSLYQPEKGEVVGDVEDAGIDREVGRVGGRLVELVELVRAQRVAAGACLHGGGLRGGRGVAGVGICWEVGCSGWAPALAAVREVVGVRPAAGRRRAEVGTGRHRPLRQGRCRSAAS